MTHPMFDPTRRCLPVEEWPSADRALWARATAKFDPLEAGVGLASRWSDATRNLTLRGYGAWLGWLERAGKLERQSAPGERATREQVGEYLAMLTEREYAPFTIAGRLQQLGDALRVMVPAGDWTWLTRASWRVRQSAEPVTDFDGKMRPPEEVLQLGMDLMHHAESDRFRTDFDRAVMFRDGLCIAGLILRPLRIKNFAGIRIGPNLASTGEGWELSFTGEEMKAERPFQCSWPEELNDPLNRYLDRHRVTLLEGKARRTDALWVAKRGAGMTRTVLADRITKRTGDEFGTAINPHCFRHIAATTVATMDPDNITSVPAILGHATLETSEKHYNRARMVDAGETYQRDLERRRARMR